VLNRMWETKGDWSSSLVADFLGTEHKPAVVRVLMSRLRAKLRGTGWTIDTHEGGGKYQQARYSIVRAA
jgi:hypothetical protein